MSEKRLLTEKDLVTYRMDASADELIWVLIKAQCIMFETMK